MLDGAQAPSPPASSAGQTLTPLRSPFRVAVYYPALSSGGVACQPRSLVHSVTVTVSRRPLPRALVQRRRVGGRRGPPASQPTSRSPHLNVSATRRPAGWERGASLDSLKVPF